LNAAIAPPVFTLSAVVKYELPRFFGITKAFRPFFSEAAYATPTDDSEPAQGRHGQHQCALAQARLHDI
jgi:hypothetical protein